MTNREITVTIMGIILGFIGSYVVSYSSIQLEQSNWKLRKIVENDQSIQKKRIDLIDQMIEAQTDFDEYKMHYKLITVTSDVNDVVYECYVEAYNNGSKNKKCGDFPEIESAQKSVLAMFKIRKKYSVTISKAWLFFGPETRNIISQLKESEKNNHKWWEVHRGKNEQLFEAMYSEINYGIKKL